MDIKNALSSCSNRSSNKKIKNVKKLKKILAKKKYL
jgi:hypothetical protein